VQARLLYRKTWPAVAQAKDWPDNEVEVMEQVQKLGQE
jgi:hypothetical protein